MKVERNRVGQFPFRKSDPVHASTIAVPTPPTLGLFVVGLLFDEL